MISLPGSAVPVQMLLGDYFPAIINGDLFYLSGMLMRRNSVAQAGPFNERLRYFNDWEFFSRLCLTGPGAHVDHDAFRRETGRSDQISRARPLTAMPRRHLFILRNLLRQAPASARYRAELACAMADACYAFGRSLMQVQRFGWGRRYLARCLRQRHKPVRSAVWFVFGPVIRRFFS